MYWRSKILTQIDVPAGAMVAVGLSWEETQKRLPDGILAACHNSADSVTISGPKDITLKFAETLRQEGIFAKPVDSMGYAFHSPYLNDLIPALRPYYEKVLIIRIIYTFKKFSMILHGSYEYMHLYDKYLNFLFLYVDKNIV